jgi:tRNA-dihydrouridine synthase B
MKMTDRKTAVKMAAIDTPLQIGSVSVPNRIFLAPMAGVTDLPFRLLCREQGAGLAYTEMISAKAVCYHNRTTAELMRTVPEDTPLALQLFSHEPEIVAEALDILNEDASFGCRFEILDINMGCPVPKIVNNGEGSALMKDPALIEKIVRAAAAHARRPVTVKLRAGFDEAHRNAVECALAAQEGGAAAVTVHGRTRQQMYMGQADPAVTAAVKEALRIPVIGNGDVHDRASAEALMRETGCDAAMIGRAARGNPWAFSTGRRPGKQETAEMILRHAALQKQYKPAAIAMKEMRMHVAWYIAGFPGASRIRGSVNSMETYEDLERLLREDLPG